MADAAKIVSEFREAMGRGDFASARQLLHDDLSFRGPIGVFDTADAFIEAWKTLPIRVERVEVRKVFADSEDVCVLFDLITDSPRCHRLGRGMVSRDGRSNPHDAGCFRCSTVRRCASEGRGLARVVFAIPNNRDRQGMARVTLGGAR